jgi:hypothetical protein
LIDGGKEMKKVLLKVCVLLFVGMLFAPGAHAWIFDPGNANVEKTGNVDMNYKFVDGAFRLQTYVLDFTWTATSLLWDSKWASSPSNPLPALVNTNGGQAGPTNDQFTLDLVRTLSIYYALERDENGAWGSTFDYDFDMAVVFNPVPLPATALLLGSGILAFVGFRRRTS